MTDTHDNRNKFQSLCRGTQLKIKGISTSFYAKFY